MNERIRLLAEQAGFFPERNWDHTGWHAAGHNDTFEKFAELIVRECIDVLNPDNDLTSMREEYGRKMSMRLIKKHFGVEE